MDNNNKNLHTPQNINTENPIIVPEDINEKNDNIDDIYKKGNIFLKKITIYKIFELIKDLILILKRAIPLIVVTVICFIMGVKTKEDAFITLAVICMGVTFIICCIDAIKDLFKK